MATKEMKKNAEVTEVINPKMDVVESKKNEAEAAAKAAQKEFEKKAKELEKCLKELEAKKTLAAYRTKFLEVLDRLQDIKTELQPSDNFDTESFSLTFSSKLNYSARTEFSISNTMIILEFIDYITDRINKKVEELEAEIIK